MAEQIIQNYRILSAIGESSIGSLYVGEHITLHTKVAIEMLRQEQAMAPEIKNKLLNEVQKISELSYKNIIRFLDLIEDKGNLYLIMEYVEGASLDNFIHKINKGPIPESNAIEIFKQILDGFAYAHRKGIIHGSVNPGNIILASDYTPKVLNFGIERIIEGEIRNEKTTGMKNRLIYKSPEQIQGINIDYRTDIYSLGLLLYEMLTGKNPYETLSSDYEIRNKILQESLPDITLFNPNVSKNIQSIIAKATAKNPEDRFQSCEEFQQAVLGIRQVPPVAEATRVTYNAGSSTVQQNAVNYGTSPENKNNKNTIILIISGAALVVIIAIVLIIFVFSGNSSSSNGSKESMKTEKNKIENNQQSLPETEKRNELSQNQTRQNNTYGVPGVYPESSLRELSVNELLGYSKSQLRLMRNEIYARHGRKFESPDLINYFNSQSWYTPLFSDNEVQYMLTNIEKKNIITIQQAEKLVK